MDKQEYRWHYKQTVCEEQSSQGFEEQDKVWGGVGGVFFCGLVFVGF